MLEDINLNVSEGLASPQGGPRGGLTGSNRLGDHPERPPPATPAKTPAHLQNLISLQDALAVSWAARLNPGYKDAHVIASGQPQPNVRALEEADHPRVWAVPAQRGGGGVRWEAESGQAEAESCGRRSQVDGELPGFVAEPPKPGCPGKAHAWQPTQDHAKYRFRGSGLGWGLGVCISTQDI